MGRVESATPWEIDSSVQEDDSRERPDASSRKSSSQSVGPTTELRSWAQSRAIRKPPKSNEGHAAFGHAGSVAWPASRPLPPGLERVTYVTRDGSQLTAAGKRVHGDPSKLSLAEGNSGEILEPALLAKRTPADDGFVWMPVDDAGIKGGASVDARILAIDRPLRHEIEPVSESTMRNLDVAAGLLAEFQRRMPCGAGNQWVNLFSSGGESYARTRICRRLKAEFAARYPNVQPRLLSARAALIAGGGNCEEIADALFTIAVARHPAFTITLAAYQGPHGTHHFIMIGDLANGPGSVVRLDLYPAFASIDLMSNCIIPINRIQIVAQRSPSISRSRSREEIIDAAPISRQEVDNLMQAEGRAPLGPEFVDQVVFTVKHYGDALFDDRTLAIDPSKTYESAGRVSPSIASVMCADRIEGANAFDEYSGRYPELFNQSRKVY